MIHNLFNSNLEQIIAEQDAEKNNTEAPEPLPRLKVARNYNIVKDRKKRITGVQAQAEEGDNFLFGYGSND